MIDQRELGNNFKEFFEGLRELAGTHNDIQAWRDLQAEGLEVSSSTVRNWLSGKTIPHIRHKPGLMRIFGLSADEYANLLEASMNAELGYAQTVAINPLYLGAPLVEQLVSTPPATEA